MAASAPEIYRLSLVEGRFLAPLPSRSPAVNACGIAPSHGLFAAAGEDGHLECFDLRQRQSVGWLDAATAAGAVSGLPLVAVHAVPPCRQIIGRLLAWCGVSDCGLVGLALSTHLLCISCEEQAQYLV